MATGGRGIRLGWFVAGVGIPILGILGTVAAFFVGIGGIGGRVEQFVVPGASVPS